jgi:hypothetical protein
MPLEVIAAQSDFKSVILKYSLLRRGRKQHQAMCDPDKLDSYLNNFGNGN